MQLKKEQIDNLIKKLDKMIKEEMPKEEIKLVIEELDKLLKEYLEE